MLVDEYDQSGTTGWNFADQRFGAFVFVVAGAAALVLLIVIFLREFYWRKYGVNLCPSFLGFRRIDNEQMGRDRIMAEELQRRLNDEERESERVSKRKERRAWYEDFIKDSTMVSSSKSQRSEYGKWISKSHVFFFVCSFRRSTPGISFMPMIRMSPLFIFAKRRHHLLPKTRSAL
jgi:hypothetical protein